MLFAQTVFTLAMGLFARPAESPAMVGVARAIPASAEAIGCAMVCDEDEAPVVVRVKKLADGCKTSCGPDRRCMMTKRVCRNVCCDQPGKSAVGVCKATITMTDDEDEPAAETGKADRTGQKKVVCVAKSDVSSDVEPGGPWLGVQFGPVPKPLAAHLNLKKSVGQMVLNVVVDSPADKAELEQFDVIVGMDGKDASANIDDFMSVVKEFEPGQSHELSLIRGGRPMNVTVTVGERPEEIGAPKYKYENELEELAQDNVLHRGGILRKTPEGDWAFEGLGDLKNLPELFGRLPDGENFEYLFDWAEQKPGSECQIRTRTGKGETLEIKREGDKIKVTRTKKDGDGKKEVTTKVYDGEEELRRDDLEAYKMMKECGRGGIKWFGDKGNRIFITPGGDRLKFLPQDMKENIKEMMEKAAQAHEKAAEAQKLVRKKLEEGQFKTDEKLAERYSDFFTPRKAMTSFEIAEDGKIRVTTRKGQEELTEAFSSAAAMKQARPDLYAKFQKLHSANKKADTED